MSDDFNRTPTPSAQQDDSYEHTPSRQSTQSGTPSQCSNSATIAPSARTALEELYKTIYGPHSIRCLLTQGDGGLTVAHAVKRASKQSELTLYEYCLGFDFGAFHVDSRHNLFYLRSDLHLQFDANKWILLPSFAVLEGVRNFIQTVISARSQSAPVEIPDFYAKWPLKSTTKYTFIPLPSIERDPFIRPILVLSPETGQPVRQWENHFYPYHTLPDLECHIAPPFVAINGGPKLAGIDLGAITLDYCGLSDSRPALERRLELLHEIWAILQNAKEDSAKWEEIKRGKRKRDQDDEDIERLTQSSRRTTRSAARTSQDPADKNTKSRRTHGCTSGYKRKSEANLSGTTLTEHAVRHHNKRQKTSPFHKNIKRWAESIHG